MKTNLIQEACKKAENNLIRNGAESVIPVCMEAGEKTTSSYLEWLTTSVYFVGLGTPPEVIIETINKHLIDH